MQFGIYAPVPHVTIGSPAMSRAIAAAAEPLPAGRLDGQYEISREVLGAADRAGFDLILFAERHLGTDLEAWTLACAMAPQLSERIRSMVAVHPSLWHPQLIAKMATSLDRLAPGRMAINLVTGWNAEEHEMYGGGRLEPNEDRYIRAEEFVTIMHGMWTKPSLSFKGRFFEVEGAQLLLKPATSKPPEIFAASRSPRGLEMVARVGDWWFLDFDRNAESVSALEDSLRRSIDRMETLTAKLGRKVRYAFNPFILFGATREAAIAEAAGILAPDDASGDAARLNPRVRPAAMSGCVGTPEEVRAQIRRYEAMGIELLLFRFPPSVARVEAIRREVIAPMRGAGGTPS